MKVVNIIAYYAQQAELLAQITMDLFVFVNLVFMIYQVNLFVPSVILIVNLA